MTITAPRRVAPLNPYTPLDENILLHSIQHRFEAVAAQYADRLAFKTRDAALTYRELNARANQLAHALIERGGTASEPVLLLLAHSAWIPVGLLGTLKAGKFYVPLDPDHPPARVRTMIMETGAALLVTDTATEALTRSLIEGLDIPHILRIDVLDPALPETNPGVEVPPDAPAYMNFTSGTSGKPKGMVRLHSAVLAGVLGDTDDFHFVPDDRWALLSSYSFGASRKVFYGALLVGSAICALDVKREGFAELAQWLADEQVSIFYSTTSLFRHFAVNLHGAADFPRLRLIIIGSETVHAHDVKLYQRHFSADCLLVNSAGSTELSAFAIYIMDKHTVLDSAVVPIGDPARFMEVVLLDGDGRVVPAGEIGEIAVKGKYVFPGYWKDDDRNDTRFRLMPDGEWMFLTGDLGRQRPDGMYEHLGRRDFQLKIRGHRVEPAEVETALLEYPAVRGAAVFAHDAPTQPPEKRLVAYLVCDALPSTVELRRFLLQHLPDYMIPSAYVRLDAIPLNVNGKVDLVALPAPEWGMAAETLFVAPATESERYLAHLWGDLLKRDQISREDNFFELGGSSLHAGEMVIRIKRERGVSISLPALVKQTTLRDLAALLDHHGALVNRASALAVIKRSGSHARPPLFLAPPGRGHVMGFYVLGRHSDPDLPIYAFQQRGLDGTAPPYTSLAAMVTDFIELMRRAQPEGPYYLGGRSFGGLVAYEMARQLVAQGQTVACMLLFDTTFPTGLKIDDAESLESLWDAAPRLLRALRHPPREWGARVRVLLALVKKRIIEAARHDPEPGIARANRRLFQTYTVEPYAGLVVYIRALESDVDDDRVERWRGMCTGRFDVHTVPGDHDAMFNEPGVAEFARLIDRCLLES